MNTPTGTSATPPATPPAPPPKPGPGRRDSQKEQAALRAKTAEAAGKVVDINKSSKKAPAKKAASKAPAKKATTQAPATKAPAAKAAAKAPARPARSAENPRFTRGKYTVKQGETLYQATSRAGKINVRGYAKEMKYGIDVADNTSPREDARAGLIWGFAETEDAAKRVAARLTEKGYDVKIVPAVKYNPQQI
jgi:hypothetical protein